VSGAIAAGELLKDRYRLARMLGRGGMAAVWLGEDIVLDRPVAVKILADTIASDPEFVARFRREAKTAAGLSHPNLVGVYDYADDEERPYLVMQYVPGEDLGSIIAREGRTDLERLARELLDALAHIHAVGILHRDVKPGNVLIAPDGTAKLIDFGIAQPTDATSLTRTGLILGTERYAAPEVMEGRQATERSDLYSCGVLLRSCPGARTPRLRRLVEWLTSRDPRGRPVSAKQALASLERSPAAVEEPTLAFRPFEPPPPVLHRAERSRRPRWGAVLAILATLAAVAVAAGLATGGGEDRSPRASAEAGRPSESKSDEGSSAPAAAAAETPAATPPVAPEGTDPARGSALNEEGFALIQAGDYEAAVPVLEEAVRAFPPGTEDLNFAYALFNLGNALRLSGRAEEAVPILEQRLRIPNQRGTVQAELAAARRQAG
jgi:serine/threonine protein kinase